MKNNTIKIEAKPCSYDLFFKGTYNNQHFSIIDKNGEIYVNFDKHYDCLPEHFQKILDKIKEEYLQIHKKDKKWHN